MPKAEILKKDLYLLKVIKGKIQKAGKGSDKIAMMHFLILINQKRFNDIKLSSIDFCNNAGVSHSYHGIYDQLKKLGRFLDNEGYKIVKK